MDRKTFTATAKANGLTVKQLIKLSMIQSEIYWNIRFNGAEDTPTGTFSFSHLNGNQMRPINALVDAGLIIIKQWDIQVTPKGWAIQCNAGASVYMGGCSDSDITDTANEFAPITNFS